MKIDIASHNFKVTEHFKDILTKKIDRLDKFFAEETKIKVVCRQNKDINTLELTIFLDTIVCRAEVSSDNMYSNIDLALPKLEKQIVKHHERVVSKAKKDRINNVEQLTFTRGVNDDGKLVKSKQFGLVALSVEDAIAHLQLVGHSFYLYKDRTTLKTSVVYERKDGDYGVIVVD